MKFRYSIFGIILCLNVSTARAQWVQKKNYPGGIDDEAVAFAIGDTIYVGAGSSGSTAFYKFDPSTNTWTKKENILSRAAGVSFSIGSMGYAGLGQSNPTAETFAEEQGSVMNDMWEYDPTSDTWNQRAQFPGAKRDAAIAFVIGNKAYVGGGYDSSSDNIFSDFYSFDPSTNAWDTLNFLPDYVAFGTTFVIGNYAYLTAYSSTAAESSSVWQYDPSSDSWNQMNDFPGTPRESGVGFSLNGTGYLGLGQTEYESTFNDFYSYDTASDSWSTLSFPGQKNGLGWASAVTVGNAGFIALGSYIADSNLTETNGLWEFSPSAGIAPSLTQVSATVYPNPAANAVQLTFPPSGTAHVTILNTLGTACISSDVISGSQLDISLLPAGMYEIEIQKGDYNVLEKIIKE